MQQKESRIYAGFGVLQTPTKNYPKGETVYDKKRKNSSLISSLLHIPLNEILSLNIENPIIPGKVVTAKTFILDIKVLLNENKIINLEMQICNYNDWKERSLGYLCRSFDSLNRGDDYIDTKPANALLKNAHNCLQYSSYYVIVFSQLPDNLISGNCGTRFLESLIVQIYEFAGKTVLPPSVLRRCIFAPYVPLREAIK